MRGAPGPPDGFRGRWRTGEDAAVHADRISGPFSATPSVYATPSDRDDLVRLVRFAATEGLPLVPRGAGTGMPGGNLGAGIVFSMVEGFRDEGRPGPDEVCIRVGAGCTGRSAERLANSLGRTLPFLPSSAEWCTVGGMVANNAAGARSFGHGAICDWVEEIEWIDHRGEPGRLSKRHGGPDVFRRVDEDLLEAGDRLPPWPDLRKNSSGYGIDRYRATADPAQLLVGSEGTLGIITAVTLRSAAIPAARGVHLIAADGPDELTALALGAADIGASACEFLGQRLVTLARLDEDPALAALPPDPHAVVILEFEGTADEVEEGMEAARSLARRTGPPSAGEGTGSIDPSEADRLWSVRRRASPLIAREARKGRISTQFIEDSVVPPAQLGAYLSELDDILDRGGFDAVVFGHAGDGNVHVNPLVDVESPDWRPRVRSVLEEVADLVRALGGTLAGEHGDGRLRAPFLERIWGPEWHGMFARVKDHFDPEGCFNPGVIIALPLQDPLEGLTPRARSWPV